MIVFIFLEDFLGFMICLVTNTDSRAERLKLMVERQV